jgi:hypothetical protein
LFHVAHNHLKWSSFYFNFTLWLIYPRSPQNPCGWDDEENILCHCQKSYPEHPDHSLVTILSYSNSWSCQTQILYTMTVFLHNQPQTHTGNVTMSGRGRKFFSTLWLHSPKEHLRRKKS